MTVAGLLCAFSFALLFTGSARAAGLDTPVLGEVVSAAKHTLAAVPQSVSAATPTATPTPTAAAPPASTTPTGPADAGTPAAPAPSTAPLQTVVRLPTAVVQQVAAAAKPLAPTALAPRTSAPPTTPSVSAPQSSLPAVGAVVDRVVAAAAPITSAVSAPVTSAVSAIPLPRAGSSTIGGSQPGGLVTSAVVGAANVVVSEGRQIVASATEPERLVSTVAAVPANVAGIVPEASAREVVQRVGQSPPPVNGEQPTLPRELVKSAEATSSTERAPGTAPGAQPPPESGSAAAGAPLPATLSYARAAMPSIAAGGWWQAAGATRHSTGTARPGHGAPATSRHAASREALAPGLARSPTALNNSSVLADSDAHGAQPTSPPPAALSAGSTAGAAAGGSGISLALAVLLMIVLAGAWRWLRPGRERWQMPPLRLITARPG